MYNKAGGIILRWLGSRERPSNMQKIAMDGYMGIRIKRQLIAFSLREQGNSPEEDTRTKQTNKPKNQKFININGT